MTEIMIEQPTYGHEDSEVSYTRLSNNKLYLGQVSCEEASVATDSGGNQTAPVGSLQLAQSAIAAGGDGVGDDEVDDEGGEGEDGGQAKGKEVVETEAQTLTLLGHAIVHVGGQTPSKF